MPHHVPVSGEAGSLPKSWEEPHCDILTVEMMSLLSHRKLQRHVPHWYKMSRHVPGLFCLWGSVSAEFKVGDDSL